MRRTPVLAALALAGLTVGIGTGHALAGHHPAELVSTSTPLGDEPTTSTSTTEAPTPGTTPPTTSLPHGEPGPTTSTTVPEGHEHPAPPTTMPPARHEPAPTTTVAPRPEPAELTIGCSSGDGDPAVACHWDGVPAGTTKLVLMREVPGTGPSQPLWSTDDVAVRDHVDESPTVGTTYVYRVSAYAGDRYLGTSNPERIKAGGGEPAPLATTMRLACAATADDAVRCTWGDGPAGTAGFRLVRTIDDRRGRVIAEVGAAVRSADDHDVPLGSQTYYVQALDGTGKVTAVGRAEVDCCTAGDR
ncbi:MAG: hypothetical protein JWN67_1014 [Actinomycetia bacterium]|nr:hypothetical protein [Actinomycetes bacterium]